jgi:hypothetical protein
METQKFKGDSFELQMEEAAKPAFDFTGSQLDAFFAGCYEAGDWLLALYDSGRMPFSSRVPRASFVSFFKEALARFPSTGTFESYLFILEAIFGEGTQVLFDVPAAGKLEILVNAAAALEFDLTGAVLLPDGSKQSFQLVDSDGDQILARGISGIDSEAALNQLLAEIIPLGIFPDVALVYFTLSVFEALDGGTYEVVDHLGNQIVFFEV